MLKNILLGILGLTILASVYFTVSPGPVDSVAYHPPAPPQLKGVLTPNEELIGAELIAKGTIQGPEDVDVDAQGNVYGATKDGKIVKVLQNGQVEEFANTGGRPLGLDFDKNGNLIVCEAFKGLLSIAPNGEITVLSTEAEGIAFRFTDDVEVADDGIIYFSDASSKFDQHNYKMDLLETKPYGRLLAYDPNTKETTVLIRDLYFANGVAISQKGDFVLVNETYRYQIRRYWLKGPNKGTVDTFIDNLPGFPDGVSSSGRGTFWLALYTLRNKQMDTMHPIPWLKNLVAKLPPALSPKPIPYGLVIELDEKGNILRSLHDATGQHLHAITSAQEHHGQLYLGSLDNDRIGKLRL